MIKNGQSKKRKRTINKTNNFGNFFSANFLNILGVLFLCIGLFYLIDLYSDFLYNLYQGLMVNGQEGEVGSGVISQEYFYELVLYFSPAIVGLVCCIAFFEKIKQWVVLISILLIFYLLYFHFKISIYCSSSDFSLYSNFFEAGVLLFIMTALLCVIYLRSKNTLLFFFIVFQFYVSLIILKIQFLNFYLIPSSFVFSLGFYWVSNRVKSLSAIFINFIFATLFFSFFALKKLILGSFPEYINLFLVFSLLFYIVFLMISFSKSFYGKKGFFLIFSLANSVFYFVVNALILSIYYDRIYLIYPILALLVFQVMGVFFVRKNNLKLWVFPMELNIAVLVAGLFIVLLNQDGTALILGALSIVLIKHALIEKNKLFVWLSFASIMMMTLYFIGLFIGLLTPMLNLKMERLESLFIDDLLNVFATGISLYLVKNHVIRLNSIVSKKEFNIERYLVFLSGFLLVTFFLLFEGISFILVHLLTHTFLYSSLILFILGSLFFLILFKNIDIVDVKLTKPLFGMILFFNLLFPITEYFDVPISKYIYLLSSNFSFPRIVLHYIGLLLFFVISIVTVKKVYQINLKNSFLQRLIEVFCSLVIILIVCKEYDFISILFNLADSKSFSIIDLNLVLDSNQFLPYSILMLICSFSILIYGVVHQNRFLKVVSIVGAGILFVRTFLFGYEEIYQDFRVPIFFILGIMFLIFSWSEKTIKKERKSNKVSNNKLA